MIDKEHDQLMQDFEKRNEDRKFRHRPELYTMADAKAEALNTKKEKVEEILKTESNNFAFPGQSKEAVEMLKELKFEHKKESLADSNTINEPEEIDNYLEIQKKLDPEEMNRKISEKIKEISQIKHDPIPPNFLRQMINDATPPSTIDQGYTENDKLENSEIYYPKVSSEEPVKTEKLFDEVYGETINEDTAPDLMEQGAALYRQRNALYGNSYKKQGRILEVLFPNGVQLKTVKDFNRFTVFTTIISKILRYSNDFNTPHDDSVLDNMVYFAMLLELDRTKD